MPKLCKAGVQLRNQIDDLYPQRERKSDGWIGDSRHSARKSDHNPDENGIVRAIDIDRDLAQHPEEAHALVEKLRQCAKRGDRRIKYIIFDGKIMSPILGFKRRLYKGANPHKAHFHVSFTKLGDKDGSWFDLEGEGKNGRLKTDGGIVAEDFSRDGSIDVSVRRTPARIHPQCGTCECTSFRD